MTLQDLGDKYGTDKGNAAHSHKGLSFLKTYEFYFETIRMQPINLLEMGARDGRSLRMWRDYFPHGNIYGLDNNPASAAHESDRIHIEIGSQDDPTVLSKFPAMDIIIDDASHINSLTLASCRFLLPRLKSPGYYIIEDMETSYLDLSRFVEGGWNGELKRNANAGVNLCNNRKDIDDWILTMVHDLDHRRGDLYSVSFWHQMIIIMK